MVNFAVLIDGVLEADYFLPVCMVVTVVFLLVGLGVIVKTTSWSREANECVAQMRNVCDDFSSQHQGISFHFREARVDQQAFIEGLFVMLVLCILFIFWRINDKQVNLCTSTPQFMYQLTKKWLKASLWPRS